MNERAGAVITLSVHLPLRLSGQWPGAVILILGP